MADSTTTHPTADPTTAGPADGILVRPLTADDWAGAKALDAAAFGYDTDDDFLDTVSLPALDISRFLGAFDPVQGDLESRDSAIVRL